jgi:hypothetical protein
VGRNKENNFTFPIWVNVNSLVRVVFDNKRVDSADRRAKKHKNKSNHPLRGLSDKSPVEGDRPDVFVQMILTKCFYTAAR